MSTRPSVKTSVDVSGLRRPIEPFEIACVLIGAAAIGLASFVGWAGHDRTGASLILMAAAGVLALFVYRLRNGECD